MFVVLPKFLLFVSSQMGLCSVTTDRLLLSFTACLSGIVTCIAAVFARLADADILTPMLRHIISYSVLMCTTQHILCNTWNNRNANFISFCIHIPALLCLSVGPACEWVRGRKRKSPVPSFQRTARFLLTPNAAPWRHHFATWLLSLCVLLFSLLLSLHSSLTLNQEKNRLLLTCLLKKLYCDGILCLSFFYSEWQL